jgi:tetratricopeptide (TPR) repeat protein
VRRPPGAVAAIATVIAFMTAVAQAAELNRAQALAALADQADGDRRRTAAERLADVGTMEDLPALVRALRDTAPAVRAMAERSMWQIWSRSGDAGIDQLFAVGVEQMSSRAGDDAVGTFTRIIERRPEFAEGWNKRATVYYLMGEYTKSLADCDEVMKRNPYHFGALSGYGMIHVRLGNPARALEYFEKALAINPNLDGVRDAAENLRQLLHERRRNTI